MKPHMPKGIILAGGKSLRFGGDKALAEINGTRLIEKAVRSLQSLGLETAVITNPKRDYSFLNCRIENDLIPEKGPLGGLHAAFHFFPDDPLLVLTCDMPEMTPSALEVLLRAHRRSSPVTLLRSGNAFFQPFPGIYQPAVKYRIDQFLHGEKLSMQAFLEGITGISLISPLEGASLFTNINTKEDLRWSFPSGAQDISSPRPGEGGRK